MEKQLTVKEVAELLKCTEDTVRVWANNGSLVGSKATGSWLFNESDVETYRNGGKAKVSTESEELAKARQTLELIKVNNEIEANKLGMDAEAYKKAVVDVRNKTNDIEKAVITFNNENNDNIPDAVTYKAMYKEWWYFTHTHIEYDKAKAGDLSLKCATFEVTNHIKYHPLQYKIWRQDIMLEWCRELMDITVESSKRMVKVNG